jgi:hypothetical protein
MFHVDPRWYQAYWFSEPSRSPLPTATAAMARLAVAVLVLGGGAALLDHLRANDPWQGYQQWERE